MLKTVVLLASLQDASLTIHDNPAPITVPVIYGKPSSPTPEGFYVISKGYARNIRGRVLIFRREGSQVWAIHENLASRSQQLKTPGKHDNYLSGGCIGVDRETFNRLWAMESIILQVF